MRRARKVLTEAVLERWRLSKAIVAIEDYTQPDRRPTGCYLAPGWRWLFIAGRWTVRRVN